MKKLLIACLALFMVLSLAGMASAAQHISTFFEFAGPVDAILPGQAFSADILIEGIPADNGLTSMGLQFTYDPAQVSVTSLTNDAAWFLPVSGLPAIDNVAGLAELGAGKIPGTAGPDPILLGSAEFECMGPFGLTQLVMGELFPDNDAFDSMVLADGTVLDKDIAYGVGEVNQVPIPGTLLLFGSGLFGLAAFRRKRK